MYYYFFFEIQLRFWHSIFEYMKVNTNYISDHRKIEESSQYKVYIGYCHPAVLNSFRIRVPEFLDTQNPLSGFREN